MDLERKKFKVLSQCFDLPLDKVECLFDAYLAMTLYNIQSNGSDDTIFGEVKLDKNNNKFSVVGNSEKTTQIFNGNVDIETFKRFLLLGDHNI